MPGHLAAEDPVGLAHSPLEERVPDAVHQRRAAVALDDVPHGIARAQVVDDRRPGVLEQERFGQQRRDEVARHELARAVDEEAAVRVAVPRDADVRAIGHHALHDVAPILFDSGLASCVGKRPSMVKQSLDVVQGSRSKSSGPMRPPMPQPASSTTLNGLMSSSSMNDITCSMYGAMMSLEET